MSIPLGQVHNGVVVFQGGVSLPDGTAVRVEPVERADQPTSWPDWDTSQRPTSFAAD